MTAGGGRAPARGPQPAGALAARPALSPTSGPMLLLLRTFFTVTKPVRMLIAFNLLMGRSLQRLAAAIARGALLAAGWLYGRVAQRSSGLIRFERQYRVAPRRWHAVLGSVLALQLARWGYRRWVESASGKHRRRRELQLAMRSAQNFSQWCEAAVLLEELEGDRGTRRALEARLYDRRLLQERRSHLGAVRGRGDVIELMFALRADLLRNLGNITNSELHEHFPLVPEPIRGYIEEVKQGLRFVTDSPELPLDDKLNFLREARHAFGRTALVLSGGGSFGSFHLGVVKALLDAGLLPRVISGSSAGSIVSAMISTRSDAELYELFECLPDMEGIDFYRHNTAGALLKNLMQKGTLQDHELLQHRLKRLLGDITFAEAYQRSGRILNIAVCAADTSEPPRLLNYLTAPAVLVWSAVACSSAFPFLFQPQDLMARDNRGRVVRFTSQAAAEMQRRWRDGSLEEDLPMRGLSEMFNVNYFLVSQCNPYLLPIVAFKKAMPGKLGALIEGEFKHRCKQLMDVLPRGLGASRLLKLLNQPWEGDVNMVLPFTTFGTLKSVINLTKEDLLLAIQVGQRAAWAKLSAIQANCAIEVTMDECLKQVTAVAAKQRRRMTRGHKAPVMRRGIPSWVHMPSMGLPRPESYEAGMAPVQSVEALDIMRAASNSLDELPPLSPSISSQQLGPEGMVIGQPVPVLAVGPLGAEGATPLGQDLTTISVPEEVEGEEEGAAEEEGPTPRDPMFERGADVWKDLFSLAPASSALNGDALDFIAP